MSSLPHRSFGLRQIDFRRINEAALLQLPSLLRRWLPHGRAIGPEWVTLNPTRQDRHHGSFKINMRTCKWADFATGDDGGDPVSLAAYLFGLSQGEAGRRIACMLGIEESGR